MRKIALLVDGPVVSKYVKDLVDWAEQEPDLEISALIIHPAPQSSVTGLRKFVYLGRQQGFYTALSRTAFAVMVRIESALFLRGQYREHVRSYDIGERVREHVVTTPIVSKSGFVYRFSEEDLAAIRALDADIFIRCGNGILKGGILAAARHGVLSLHHGDNRVNRGGPAAFWEVLERHPSTGYIIQRLTEELDGGDVLFRGNVSTDAVFVRNRCNLYERSNIFLKKTISDVLDGRAEPEQPLLYDRRLYKTPLLGASIRYAFKTATHFGRKAIRRAFGYHWRWGVGYTNGTWRKAVLWRARLLKNPPGQFLADPFALIQDGRRFIFVEDYIYAKKKGVISAYEVHPDRTNTRLGIVLEEDFHLSFPFIFRFGGELYMCPETPGVRQIRLYKSTGFPMTWEPDRVLIDGVNASDTIIFEQHGRWWMLTTINQTGLGANDSELFLYVSDNPLNGWTPHHDNPVIVDSSRGRNGGFLQDETGTYRIAQRHAFAHYGAGCAIMKLDLEADSFAETKVQDIDPAFFPKLRGTHHLHQDGDLLVFDYVRSSRVKR